MGEQSPLPNFEFDRSFANLRVSFHADPDPGAVSGPLGSDQRRGMPVRLGIDDRHFGIRGCRRARKERYIDAALHQLRLRTNEVTYGRHRRHVPQPVCGHGGKDDARYRGLGDHDANSAPKRLQVHFSNDCVPGVCVRQGDRADGNDRLPNAMLAAWFA